MTAYALGRWDPHKAPPLPRSSFARQHQSPDVPPEHRIFSISASGDTGIAQLNTSQGASSPRLSSDPSSPSRRKDDTPPQKSSPPSSSSTTTSAPPTPGPTPGPSSLVRAPSTSHRTSSALNISASIPHHLRGTFADIRSSTGARPIVELPPAATAAPVVLHADATTTAAAMRWAAARVNIAPLALPSPEHELTDPFRNARTAIPGSYPPDISLGPQSPRHRQRVGSFWQGTIDVVDDAAHSSSTLGSIQGSPPSTPPSAGRSDSEPEPDPPSAASTRTESPPYVTPVSVPVRHSIEHSEDYFGRAALSASPEPARSLPRQPQDMWLDQTQPTISSEAESIMTVPVASRRVNPSRQILIPALNKAPGSSAEVSPPTRVVDAGVGRALNEEAMFLEHGHLAPPYPPDELERCRALYQFNIWNTGPDINFERIEHLTKLVFSTKTVIISLIDGDEQYVIYSPCGGFLEELLIAACRWIKSACECCPA